MPFPQAPAGSRRIHGGWWRSGWLWCCGKSCWWCSRRMTKRSNPAGSGRGRRGASERRVESRITPSETWVSLNLWAGAESCCHTQGLPPATWLYQGITTLFSTSRYTLVLTFNPTSKIRGGMMRPALKTTPKTITVAGNFVFIILDTSLLFVAIQRWFWLCAPGPGRNYFRLKRTRVCLVSWDASVC